MWSRAWDFSWPGITKSGLFRLPRFGVQVALGCARARFATSGAAEDVGDGDRQDGADEWTEDVDPVVGEGGPDQVGTERARWVHRCAGDRAAPEARERDIPADAERSEDPDVLGAR